MRPFQSLDQVRTWADFVAQGNFSVLLERNGVARHLTCVGHRTMPQFWNMKASEQREDTRVTSRFSR